MTSKGERNLERRTLGRIGKWIQHIQAGRPRGRRCDVGNLELQVSEDTTTKNAIL